MVAWIVVITFVLIVFVVIPGGIVLGVIEERRQARARRESHGRGVL